MTKKIVQDNFLDLKWKQKGSLSAQHRYGNDPTETQNHEIGEPQRKREGLRADVQLPLLLSAELGTQGSRPPWANYLQTVNCLLLGKGCAGCLYIGIDRMDVGLTFINRLLTRLPVFSSTYEMQVPGSCNSWALLEMVAWISSLLTGLPLFFLNPCPPVGFSFSCSVTLVSTPILSSKVWGWHLSSALLSRSLCPWGIMGFFLVFFVLLFAYFNFFTDISWGFGRELRAWFVSAIFKWKLIYYINH